MAAAIRIGTAGWSYPHWNGIVYPQRPSAGFHPLEWIARHLDVVEINSSFYQPLRPELTRLWLKKTERHPDFQFTAKLHQQFTHHREVNDAAVRTFKEGLWPLLRADKLGALVMQFPWNFRFTQENHDFFLKLRRSFHEFPLVAEMRHDSWLAAEAQGVFMDYKVGFVNIDQPAYTRATPPTAILTSPVGYVRLHGRNPQNSLGAYRPGASRSRQHDYLYRLEELVEWADRVERISRFAERTLVVFNNDAGGKSFVNALQLQELMGCRRSPAPAGLRRRYPVELENMGPRQAQQWLFPAA
jgi:uncharacterized protein YecE (DUF72 family)